MVHERRREGAHTISTSECRKWGRQDSVITQCEISPMFHMYGTKINESLSKHFNEYYAQSNGGIGDIKMQTHKIILKFYIVNAKG